MFRKNIFLAVLIVLCFAVTASAETYKWKLAHTRSPENQTHKALLKIAEKVKQGTNGDVQITIMSGGQLGNWVVAQERVAMGNFEMTIAPFATAVSKRMEDNWESVGKNMVVGSPFIDLISKWSMEQNIEILGTYPSYFGGIGLTKDIENPGDPSVKRGLKIRIPELASFRLLVGGLKYIPTPIAYTDVFPALQTGVVEGIAGAGAEPLYTGGFADVLKSYLPINTHFEIWFLMVNPEKLAKLPKEYQEVVRRESIAMQNKRLKDAPGIEKHWEAEMAKKGVKVYDITPEQLSAYQKAMRDSSWGEIRKIVGEGDFDKATSLLK